MKYLIIFLLSVTLIISNKVPVIEFTEGNNLFAASAYKKISENSTQNFLLSPLSIEIILALVQSGCRGETAQEIQTALYLPNSNEKIESAIKTVLSVLEDSEHCTFNVANKIYLKEELEINEKFQDVAARTYQVDIEIIDFTNKTQATQTMNNWVEKETDDKIQNFIDIETLNECTRAILINTLYFKGNWTHQFASDDTKQRNFYKTAEDVVQVETMHLSGRSFNYYESLELNAKFLELPFDDENISMTILLPNEKEGLSKLESRIDKAFNIHELTSELVDVALPKFKIQNKIDFKPILQDLGIKKAFDEGDLSGIGGEKGDVVISGVIQEVFIDVEERGVEVAAATAVVVEDENLMVTPTEPKLFIVDHPFMFYIKANNVIIFTGRVLEPYQ